MEGLRQEPLGAQARQYPPLPSHPDVLPGQGCVWFSRFSRDRGSHHGHMSWGTKEGGDLLWLLVLVPGSPDPWHPESRSFLPCI